MVRRLDDEADPNRVPARFNPGVALKVAVMAVVVAIAGRGDPVVSAIAAGCVAVLLGLNSALYRMRAQRRRAELAGLYPDADLVDAWVPEGAGLVLLMAGVAGESGLSSWWASQVTVVLADDRFELWRGGRAPRQVAAVPWTRVELVGRASGKIARVGSSPGVRVRFTPNPDEAEDEAGDEPGDRDEIVLVPCRRVGTVSAGSAAAADRLHDALCDRTRWAGRRA